MMEDGREDLSGKVLKEIFLRGIVKINYDNAK
jgi:hypothetical protein